MMAEEVKELLEIGDKKWAWKEVYEPQDLKYTNCLLCGEDKTIQIAD